MRVLVVNAGSSSLKVSLVDPDDKVLMEKNFAAPGGHPAGGLRLVWLTPPAKHEVTYTQITNFTDSAVGPALIAFWRPVPWGRQDG